MQRILVSSSSAVPRLAARLAPATPLRGARAVSHGAPAAPRAAPLAGNAAAAGLYKVVFAKNGTYLLYVLVGAVVLDTVYGTVLDGLWSSANRGVRARGRRARARVRGAPPHPARRPRPRPAPAAAALV